MKKKGALLASSAMVLAAAAALTTASFAWFTTSLTPSVGDITMSVTSADSLMISAVSTGSFKSTVTETELTAVSGNQLAGSGTVSHKIFSVTPATANLTGTDGTKTFTSSDGTLAFQNLAANPGATGAWDASVYQTAPAYAAAAAEMPYVMFDLYFKSTTEENVKLTLDLSTDYTATYNGTKVIPWDTATSTEITATNDPRYYVTHSLRLAFVATQEDVGQTAATYVVKTYEPNATAITDDIKAVIGESTYDTTASRTYKADAQSVANGQEQTQTPVDLDLGLELEQNNVYKVRCYIWMEGNDPANANLISASAFKTMLKFTGEKVTQP